MEINIRRVGIGIGFLVLLFLMIDELLIGSNILKTLLKHIDEAAIIVCLFYIALNR